MNKIIVRFAPSPTGQLHLGGARTALFNYLYAKKYNGKFLLRIEDTDLERSKAQYTEQIIKSLNWLGLEYDEKPIFQSERNERYSEVVELLLSSGNAYKCFCSKEELLNNRKETFTFSYSKICRNIEPSSYPKDKPYSIRIKVPLESSIQLIDKIYSNINVSTKEIDDFIIARTDGTPTYNFVVVIDDHDMNISTVIRGEDHIPNTTKQIMIYNLLGWKLPEFAHLPMILGQDKKRLSKRHGATGLGAYRDLGYSPHSMVNYLAMLGWNSGTEKEIFNRDELVSEFSLKKISKRGAIFDLKKLNWINGQYLMKEKSELIYNSIIDLSPHWGNNKSKKYCYSVIDQLKLRSESLIDFINQSDYYFNKMLEYDNDLKSKVWRVDTSKIIYNYIDSISKVKIWNSDSLEVHLKEVVSDLEVGFGKVMQPVRFLITGKINGPSLFETMVIIGKVICLKRLKSYSKF